MHFRAYEYLASQPLMVLPETLEAAVAISLRLDRDGPAAVEARRGKARDAETPGVADRDGVRTIPVLGPIFRYADLLTDLCGGTTLEAVARDLQAAVDDPNVRAILLNIDSPGGEAAGIGEFAAMVRAASARKPLAAYIGAMGASAAYWIACGAPRIVMAEAASVGSIGVVLGYPLRTAKDRERSVEFVSSQSPRKRPDPQTDAGRAAIQERVDDLASVFIKSVAGYRGTTPATVESDFGRGGVLIASKAVAAGMADAVGTYESTLADLARRGATGQLLAPRKAAAASPAGSVSDPAEARRRELLAMTETGREQLRREDAGKPAAKLDPKVVAALETTESGRAALDRMRAGR